MSSVRTTPRQRPSPADVLPADNRIHQPVLVVEDNRSLGELARAMLHAAWGCEVVLAATRAEAEAALAQRGKEFLVAVLDLNLPDAPHGEVIDSVNAAGLPSIVLTGAFGEEMRNLVSKKNVVDYVLKESVNAYEYVTQMVGRLYKNQSIKVLVADDSLSSRAVLKLMLVNQRFEVVVVDDGRQALEVLRRDPEIQMLFTDYNMPEMNGIQLTLEARRSRGKDRLAIIGLSSQDDGRLSAHFLKAGANDFLRKPFTYEELYCRVSQNLEMLEHIEAIRDAANRDYLTRLHNRRYFFETGGRHHAAALRGGSPLAAAMMDIDHFKRVNDRYGHDGGDEALKKMAKLLAEHFGDLLVARFGGEEFAVLAAGIELERARERFEAFRRAVEASPARCGEREIPFTVSIGLSDRLGANLDEMLKVADENLYRAKEGGRNRVV